MWRTTHASSHAHYFGKFEAEGKNKKEKSTTVSLRHLESTASLFRPYLYGGALLTFASIVSTCQNLPPDLEVLPLGT